MPSDAFKAGERIRSTADMPHDRMFNRYPPPPGQDLRYENEIRLLQKLNSCEHVPDNAVVFTGSSIFRFWSTLARDMAPLPVLNRAFGGARTWEVLHFYDRIIAPCRPRIIAYYCGSNDIECNEQPGSIAARIQAFVELVQQELPRCRIFFVSINLAPQKRSRWDAIQSVNSLIERLCEGSPALSYINVNTVLLDEHAQPRRELFQEDGLHLRPAAYHAFTGIMQPVLLQTWREITAPAG
jgi:lysophospholipase L1-like esterase